MSKHKRHRRDRDRDEDIEKDRYRRDRDRNSNEEDVEVYNNKNGNINNIMDMLNNIDQDQLNNIMQSLGISNSFMGNTENSDAMTSGRNVVNVPPVQDKAVQLLYALKPMLTPDKAILIDRIIQIYSLGKTING